MGLVGQVCFLVWLVLVPPVDGSLLHVLAFRAGAFGWHRVHDDIPASTNWFSPPVSPPWSWHSFDRFNTSVFNPAPLLIWSVASPHLLQLLFRCLFYYTILSFFLSFFIFFFFIFCFSCDGSCHAMLPTDFHLDL